jgi:hypothetical protein
LQGCRPSSRERRERHQRRRAPAAWLRRAYLGVRMKSWRQRSASRRRRRRRRASQQSGGPSWTSTRALPRSMSRQGLGKPSKRRAPLPLPNNCGFYWRGMQKEGSRRRTKACKSCVTAKTRTATANQPLLPPRPPRGHSATAVATIRWSTAKSGTGGPLAEPDLGDAARGGCRRVRRTWRFRTEAA